MKPWPRERGDSHPSTRGPLFASHPLAGTDVEFRGRIVSAIASAADRFQEQLTRLVALSAQVSPLHVLSILATYGLMASVGDAAQSAKGLSRSGVVSEGQVECMQALLLRHAEVQTDPPSPNLMQEIFDGLPALFEAHGRCACQAE